MKPRDLEDSSAVSGVISLLRHAELESLVMAEIDNVLRLESESVPNTHVDKETAAGGVREDSVMRCHQGCTIAVFHAAIRTY